MKKLSENILMTGISPKIVLALEKKAKKFKCEAGEALFNEGDEGTHIYLIESGVVQVLKHIHGDHFVLLNELKEGDFVGELALFDRQGRSATAKAVSQVTGWKFDDSILDAFFSERKEESVSFLRTLSARMREVDTCLVRQKEMGERLTVLGNMVGSIAHDLKNPLTAMRMSAELLEMKTQDPASKKLAVTITGQIDRLTAMLHDLLEYVRDKIEIRKQNAVMDEVVNRCRDLFAENCRSAGIELVLELNAPRAFAFDPGKMERVLINLVKNSVQALKERKGGKIVIQTEQTENETRIRVVDNGPGVPEGIRNLIFEPFVSSGKMNGTGLGLSIVKKIVESHGGRVSFHTETSKGTTFWIALPG